MKAINLLSLLLVCNMVQAQFPEYHVFLVSGSVESNRPGAKPVALKQNAFIFKDQVIILKDKAELTLSDKNKNFYVLRTPGTYKAKDLPKIVNYRVPGVTEKYLTLVWNELFNTHHDYSKFTKSNVAGVYGGVSRGSDCNNLLFPIADLKTSEDSLHFNWLKTSMEADYTFSLYNQEGKEMLTQSVADTQLILGLKTKLDLQPGTYYWKVKSANGKCEDDVPVSFEIITGENEKKAAGLIVNGNIDDNLPAQLASIDKLEKAGLISAAAKHFEELIKNNKDDKALLKSYVLFLGKYKYNGKAETIWAEAFSKK